MKFVLLCLLAAYCYAADMGEELLSKIERHESILRMWAQDNSQLLSTVIEKQKKYENAKKNERILLETVDYLVKTNMEMLENVLTQLKNVRTNLNEGENLGEASIENKFGKVGDDSSSNNYETDSDTRTLQFINDIMKNNGKRTY
ncbi:uncharacterized protein LOC110999023 [Pieris rapae]|uniref:uncharacterized protein LOC110999023 n=1 Tax=Pieris rapae TaxID=64459 RepID=UPI001E2812CD|nr:uncharacterized protein LOC110999023 [Pieris rapae]